MNPRTGLVRRLTHLRPEPGDPPLVVVGADVATPEPLGGGPGLSASGAAGFSWREAEAAALGEACERYAASFVPRERHRVATARETPGAVASWALFSERQYAHPGMRFAPWRDDARVAWTPATRLHDGAPAWVPAQFVHLPYAPLPDEPLMAPCYSTGLSAAPDLPRALLWGLYEIVERDHFTLAWLHAARPPMVRPADHPPRVRALAAYGRLRLLDLTGDVGLPTYLCALEKPSVAGTLLAVGAATRHDPSAAAEKAVVEAFQTAPYVLDLVRAEPRWRAGARWENLRDFRDHARFYTVHPEHRAGLAHLLDGPLDEVPLRPPPDEHAVEDRLRDAMDRMRRRGMETYAVDLTPDDVAEAGLRVVRVLAPQAQPLHSFYQGPHLGSRRFREASRALPWLDRARPEEEVHPWPHPFA